MNLSRAAKKLRAQMPQEPDTPKPAAKKAATPPPPPPVAVPAPEPTTEKPEPMPEVTPEAAPPAATPKKGWRVKVKRPRFVREKTEKQERPPAPALPPPSTKLAARLMTRNLALPPKEDQPGRR